MRKTALKKRNPNRHTALMLIRETYAKNIEEFTSSEGRIFCLNLKKRILLDNPYRNSELFNEFNRKYHKFINKNNSEDTKEKSDG